MGEAKKICSTQQPKGEITLLIEGKMTSDENEPNDDQLELELKEFISKGHSLSVVGIVLLLLQYFFFIG